jgi:hypothetical protein
LVPILLFIGFLAQLYLSIADDLSKKPASTIFSVPPPDHTVGLYHLILIPLITVLYSRRYLVALVIAASYTLFHASAIYLELQGCFLGEDICPPVSNWTKAAARFSWFDWAATIVIPLILVSVVVAASRHVRQGRNLR